MSNLYCNCCGGTLGQDPGNPNRYRCLMCGKEHQTAVTESFSELMQAFDTQTRERVQKLLRLRHAVVSADYISCVELTRVCDELLTLMPDDFLSVFYKIAAGNNLRALNRAIREIDVETYYDDVAEIVPFLVKSMTEDKDCLLALNDLVERAYKGSDLSRFHQFASLISEQAEKVRAGVYETSMPRDVFVAYSSKDMPLVMELVEELEERQGFSCFVAARNLRHGVGSVENYNAALAEAIDNCRTVVFVSTTNSRSFSCDALKIELAYIMQQDIAAAPPQLRNNYEAIPPEYKKPRVEYRAEPSKSSTAADRKVAQFFAGYEWVLTPSDVADRVADQIFAVPNAMSAAHGSTYGTAQPSHTPAFNAEEEIQRRVTEELRRQAEEEERRRIEEETRRRVEEETRRRAEEAERQRQAEVKRQRQAEERRRAAEAERQRQAEAERQRQEEARRRAAEAERQRQAEAERQRQEEARRRAAAQWKVGNTVKFGSYEQNPGKGKEPIEWIVLANERKRALLISKYILDCQQYHSQLTAITWENCTLRRWLNSTFLNTAFNATERGRILASRIKNPKNAKYGTNGGNDTTDHVFCLSIDEANRYFASDAARAAKATPAIKAKGEIDVKNTGNSCWWLRSPGGNARHAAYVDDPDHAYVIHRGDVNLEGYHVNIEDIGARPAFWINLES